VDKARGVFEIAAGIGEKGGHESDDDGNEQATQLGAANSSGVNVFRFRISARLGSEDDGANRLGHVESSGQEDKHSLYCLLEKDGSAIPPRLLYFSQFLIIQLHQRQDMFEHAYAAAHDTAGAGEFCGGR